MTTTTTNRVPAPVQWARGLLALVALSHLVVPIVMFAAQSTLRDEIAAQHPDFGPGEVTKSADVAVTSGAAFHGLLLVLCLLLAVKLAGGRPWTRRLTTVSQLLSVVFSVVSWSSSTMFHAVIPVVGALQIAAVVLLWAPPAARRYFTR
ncbi:hypothetical protein VA596_37110 [Amycolatopsis sp., V23-08]|uniref:Integral membrane protein n=1 Tax=Amycolatopsis heterodermiae TaxID=3110235 RepID=A0ABU5RHZ0_9PSEU|nr:hypothetical protein [Amycolatopsis sp., V23-08]MEA5365200.1 hypothetical protein [Amycolatopsis sp., V23-08]